MERKCPICQKIIRYDNIEDLEYDEKHGNCCDDCGIIDEHTDIRKETDFDEKLHFAAGKEKKESPGFQIYHLDEDGNEVFEK